MSYFFERVTFFCNRCHFFATGVIFFCTGAIFFAHQCNASVSDNFLVVEIAKEFRPISIHVDSFALYDISTFFAFDPVALILVSIRQLSHAFECQLRFIFERNSLVTIHFESFGQFDNLLLLTLSYTILESNITNLVIFGIGYRHQLYLFDYIFL